MDKQPAPTELNLDSYDINSNEVKQLAEAFSYVPKLQYLNLNEIGISSKDLKIILEALYHHSYLTHLEVCWNPFGREAVNHVAAFLTQHQSLTSLALRASNIGSEGLKILSTVLATNTTLKSLDLSINPITQERFEANQEGIRALGEMLAQNKTLTQLYLNRTKIKGKDWQILADALSVNTTLRQLQVGWNECQKEERKEIGKIIGKALSKNHHLTHLGLNNISMGTEDIKELAEGLSHNQGLIEVTFEGNPIDEIGAKALLNMLQKNRYLLKFTFTKHPTLPEETAQQMEELLLRNRRLRTAFYATLSDKASFSHADYHAIAKQNETLKENPLIVSSLHSALQKKEATFYVRWWNHIGLAKTVPLQPASPTSEAGLYSLPEELLQKIVFDSLKIADFPLSQCWRTESRAMAKIALEQKDAVSLLERYTKCSQKKIAQLCQQYSEPQCKELALEKHEWNALYGELLQQRSSLSRVKSWYGVALPKVTKHSSTQAFNTLWQEIVKTAKHNISHTNGREN